MTPSPSPAEAFAGRACAAACVRADLARGRRPVPMTAQARLRIVLSLADRKSAARGGFEGRDAAPIPEGITA